MNLDESKPALKALLANLSGLVAVWEDEPRPFTPPDTQAILILTFTSIVAIGRDQCVTTFDGSKPQGEEFGDEYQGERQATLTARVESEIQTDNGSAYWWLERTREKLQFRTTGETFRAVGCAFVRSGTTQDLTLTRDERRRSIAALEIVLNVRTSVQDPNRYGYIATAQVSGLGTGPVTITVGTP